MVSHRENFFKFLGSASNLELNKPYFETVAAAVAEKTPLCTEKFGPKYLKNV